MAPPDCRRAAISGFAVGLSNGGKGYSGDIRGPSLLSSGLTDPNAVSSAYSRRMCANG